METPPEPAASNAGGSVGYPASSSDARTSSAGDAAPRAEEPACSSSSLEELQASSAPSAASRSSSQAGTAPLRLEEWDWKRFRRRAILRQAARNHGRVELVEDHLQGQLVAVKAMPTSWVCESPAAFGAAHPEENELPWCDIAATYHLSCVARLHCVCSFIGVYRRRTVAASSDSQAQPEPAANAAGGAAAAEGEAIDAEQEDSTCLVISYCAGGDLFSWLERSLLVAGRNSSCREIPARPLIRQLFLAVSNVHAQGIAHGDLSLENVLLDETKTNVILIDFGASTGHRAKGIRGKPSYQAPEMHTGEEYDAFLADAFSLGVLVFSLVVGDYPWQSTRHQLCAKFKFYGQKGMASYLSRRKVQNNNGEIITLFEFLSPEIITLLEGLLCVDPLRRLDINSALQCPWLQNPEHSSVATAAPDALRTNGPDASGNASPGPQANLVTKLPENGAGLPCVASTTPHEG